MFAQINQNFIESIHRIDLDGVGLNESGGVASGIKLQSVLYTDR